MAKWDALFFPVGRREELHGGVSKATEHHQKSPPWEKVRGRQVCPSSRISGEEKDLAA